MGLMTDDGTARAIAWLSTWDSHGVHRTATAGDEAGADWLTAEVGRLGAAPTVELYALDRLDPVASYLEGTVNLVGLAALARTDRGE